VSAADGAKAAEDAAYLRTELLLRIAHDLRGPAGVTAGALEEIEAAVAAGASVEGLHAYLLMARRGLRRVLRVADRLQRTAELESGAIAWSMQPVDLRVLVTRAANESESIESRRAVEVHVSSSHEACPVDADADWMHAAIAEVVANAIRYARSRVEVHTATLADEVVVTVADDGPGFSCVPGPRFAPPADKRGLGLSLPIAYDVLASHRGRIEIEGVHADGNARSGAKVVMILPRQSKSAR
jgi:signal transduction histidine kinase